MPPPLEIKRPKKAQVRDKQVVNNPSIRPAISQGGAILGGLVSPLRIGLWDPFQMAELHGLYINGCDPNH